MAVVTANVSLRTSRQPSLTLSHRSCSDCNIINNRVTSAMPVTTSRCNTLTVDPELCGYCPPRTASGDLPLLYPYSRRRPPCRCQPVHTLEHTDGNHTGR